MLGINFNWGTTEDYSTDVIFADAMKTARMWTSGSNPAPLDSNFWPTTDAWICVQAGASQNDGTYQCQFTGQASVGPGTYGLAGSVQNVVYNSATNTTTFSVKITQSGGTFSLAFTNTKRLPGDTTPTGITNLQIMRPVTEASSQSYAFGTEFTDQIKALLANFKVIRFMDFFRTNGNQLQNWSQRPLPTDASYNSAYRPLPDANGDGLNNANPCGGSYEAAIDLCNATNCDFWLNVPLYASDAFVTSLATLVQTNLHSNLNVYVEYCNEVWNTGGGFPQGGENHVLAKADEAAGHLPSLKNTPTDSNDWDWAWRRVGRRIVEISNLFRTVWGDSAMPSPTNPTPRVRPVLMTQQGYEAGPEAQALMFIDRSFTTHPLNYYLYGCGGSGYYNPNNEPSLNLDTFWTSGTMDSVYWYHNPCTLETTLAHAYGLKRICYEGGPSLDKGSVSDALRAMAWGDPRMQINLVNHVNQAWSAADGDLFMFYASTGGYSWSFAQTLFNLNTPKLQAIAQLNSQPKAAATMGNAPPFTVSGSADDAELNWNSSKYPFTGASTYLSIPSLNNAMYSFRTVTAGNYSVTLTTQPAPADCQVLCDGNVITPPMATNAVSTSFSLTNLTPGVHVIMVRTQTAGIQINTLAFAGPL